MPDDMLIGVAHGSKDPRAAAVVSSLMARVPPLAAPLAAAAVRTAYLGHAAPSLPQVLSRLAPGRHRVTVVPLLLTEAYHTKVDIPGVLSQAWPAPALLAPALGPDPLLYRVLDRRLAAAGARNRPGTAVVLAAAGSSDPAAATAISQFAARWRAASGWRSVVPAYASAASPTVASAVAALRSRYGGKVRVAVATYLLAPGYFADQIAASAPGADMVSAPLGAAPEIAQIITDRYYAVRSLRTQAA